VAAKSTLLRLKKLREEGNAIVTRKLEKRRIDNELRRLKKMHGGR